LNERIADKVKKLLALSHSSNEHEAQASLLKAQELMIQHGLAMRDIAAPLEYKEVVENRAMQFGRMPWYVSPLGKLIADNFRCYGIKQRNKEPQIAIITFIGLKEDAEVAGDVFRAANEYLSARLKMVRYEMRTKKNLSREQQNRFANDYAKGFIHGLKAKFQEQIKQHDWGIVLVRDTAVEKYMEQMDIQPAKKAAAPFYNSSVYDEGYQDGRNFEQSSGYLDTAHEKDERNAAHSTIIPGQAQT
jgi:hypothetical protein